MCRAPLDNRVVLVLWGVGPILRNGCGIRDKKYDALRQESDMSAERQSRNLIVGIDCSIPEKIEYILTCPFLYFELFIKNQ